ncbi:MAG: hypothetical protein WA821_21650 [Anaerolineales bacterium]
MTDTPWKPNRLVTAYFFLVSAAGLLLIILNVLMSGPSKSALVLGLSAERLALSGGMLVLCAGLTWLGAQTLRGKIFQFDAGAKPSRRMDFMLGAALLTFLAAWLMTWIPAERFGTLYYYVGRVYPFIVWLTCFSAAGLALLLASRFGLDVKQFRAFLREQRIPLWISGAALLIFGLLSWAVALRVVNMRWQDEDFWYGAGVPLLPLQVLLAVAASIALVVIAKKFILAGKFEKKHWPDLVLFLLIWAVAAWLWASEPITPDFFITKPVAPNFAFYPDYDAQVFDVFSQYALIGQGLINGVFYERPLYSALLVYLHVVAGQDYPQLVALQAALFAIFPALGYLLGKRLHSRAAGAGLAILLTLRGMNALEIGWSISTVHQKQMMTDFATAILMLLMTVLLVRWLQEPGKNWPSLGAAAGVLGLTTLVRPHPLIFIPILIALAVWVYRQKPRVWITLSSLVLAGALAGMLPWFVSNGSVANKYLDRVKSIIHERYPGFHLPGDSMLPKPNEIAAIANPGVYFPPAAQTADKSILAFGTDNFLNNLTTTVQVLPYTPYYQGLRYTVKDGENFWRPYWDGSLSPWARVMLPINLVLIALGLGAAWKRARLSGLVPLIVMLAFYAVNALARTSGGRYLVPVDWVVIFYYFLGILALVEMAAAFFHPRFFGETALPANLEPIIVFDRAAWTKMAGVVFLFAAIGALIPLSGSFFARRYPPLTVKELSQQVSTQAGKQSNISPAELNKFLAIPHAAILQGRILYPRAFDKDQGWKVSIYTFYHPKPYPRMLFTLIGPQGETRVIFPSIQAVPLPNASDATILGCWLDGYVQAWAVLPGGSDHLIKSAPATPLICPLAEPVCDNNHHCK